MRQGIRRALKGNKALGDDIENETHGEKEGRSLMVKRRNRFQAEGTAEGVRRPEERELGERGARTQSLSIRPHPEPC